MAREARILLVEDNPADQEIARRVLGASKRRCQLVIAGDAEAAIEYLSESLASPVQAERLVDLILLDLNMPRMGGMEFLEHRRDSPALREVPVIIVSTSARSGDVRQAFRLGCASYIQKPADVPRFAELLESVFEYWFDSVLLPTRVPAVTPLLVPG